MLTHNLISLLRSFIESPGYCPMKKQILVLLRDSPPNPEAIGLADKLQRKLQGIEWTVPASSGATDVRVSLAVRPVANLAELNDHKRWQSLTPVYRYIQEHFVGPEGHSSFVQLSTDSEADSTGVSSRERAPADSENHHDDSIVVHQKVKVGLSTVTDWEVALHGSQHPLAVSSTSATSLDEMRVRRDMRLHTVLRCFLETVSHDPDCLWEWRDQLAEAMRVQKPRLEELEKQRRALLSDLELKLEACNESDLPEEELQRRHSEVANARAALERVTSCVSIRLITVDKLWRKLIDVYESMPLLSLDARARLAIEAESVPSAFAHALKRGHPIEVLDGDNLVCHKTFISAVLREVGHQPVFVRAKTGQKRQKSSYHRIEALMQAQLSSDPHVWSICHHLTP